MSHLRFNHIFLMLMFMSVLSAFVIPKRLSDSARGVLEGVFSPVSGPVRAVAGKFHERISPTDNGDNEGPGGKGRTPQAIIEENRQLRLEVANLSAQLNGLKELNADRQMLGSLRKLCRPVEVVGSDSGVRQSLSIQGTVSGLEVGMPVVYSDGLIGRIERAGWAGGAHVRLITDKGFCVMGNFGRFRPRAGGGVEFVRLTSLIPLVEGDGRGQMAVRKLAMKDVKAAGLAINDWVVLNDSDWPANLQGCKIGRIQSIEPVKKAPLFAEIRVRPTRDLMGLKEVMVMTGKEK